MSPRWLTVALSCAAWGFGWHGGGGCSASVDVATKVMTMNVTAAEFRRCVDAPGRTGTHMIQFPHLVLEILSHSVTHHGDSDRDEELTRRTNVLCVTSFRWDTPLRGSHGSGTERYTRGGERRISRR